MYPLLSKAILGRVIGGAGEPRVRQKGLYFVTVHRQGTARLFRAQTK